MSKTVTFPTAANRQPAAADAWVSGGTGTQKAAKAETQKSGDEKLARLTIDLPQDLHGRFKAACAKGRTKMKDEVLSFIEKWTQEHS